MTARLRVHRCDTRGVWRWLVLGRDGLCVARFMTQTSRPQVRGKEFSLRGLRPSGKVC